MNQTLRPAAPRVHADAEAALRPLLPATAARAAALDHDGAFPAEDVADLAAAGLLSAPPPRALGGQGLGTEAEGAAALARVLRLVGRAGLPLGRLHEGHVNALRLVVRHGTPAQRDAAARDARAGRFFAVWNTEAPGEAGLRLRALGEGRRRLLGRKILCSGAGRVERALVTARPEGEDAAPPRMLLVPLPVDGGPADLSPWTAQGMRASATGALDFTGIEVGEAALIGAPGDYHRQPDVSAGAWRFCAVQLGGAEALAEALREHLRRTGRGTDPHQAARLGHLAMALEAARLWVAEAARRAEVEDPEADAAACADLARTAVEGAALDAIELVQRSIGLQASLRPNPAERIARDLATYLRHPAPDRALTEAAAHVPRADAAVGDLWG